MKMKTAAFALLLLVGTAPAALAQPQDQGERPHARGDRERPVRPGGEMHDRAAPAGHPGGWRQAPPSQAPAAPQAHPAPQARPAPGVPTPDGARAQHFQGGGRWQGPPGQVMGQPGGGGRAIQGRPERWMGRDGDHRGANPGPPVTPFGRADREHRPDPNETRRFNDGQAGQGRRPVDPRWAGGDGQHFEGRGDAGPSGWRWSNGEWRHETWNGGGRHGRPQWRPGAYPHAYHSAHRYRIGPYIHPPHFYSHVWLFGEFLPAAWYVPDYLIDDWWNYDLPEPPPGFDWVRVGDDALLIDEYTGRIVQVVRQLFW